MFRASTYARSEEISILDDFDRAIVFAFIVNARTVYQIRRSFRISLFLYFTNRVNQISHVCEQLEHFYSLTVGASFYKVDNFQIF